MENRVPSSNTQGLVFLLSTQFLVFALAMMCLSANAQTTNPPAQPPDWAHPSGPYAVVMEEDPGIPDHTVYRPADLAVFPKQDRLPIVAFSGPGCDSNGTAFRPFFTEVASHGFLLIANGPPEPRGGSGPDFPRTTSSDHLASINWAIAENNRRDSKYYQRIDTSKIAVMGQSCGGLQTLDIANDSRFTTLVLWNSGVLNEPISSVLAGNKPADAPAPAVWLATSALALRKDVLENVHLPIAYFVGERDMAKPNALDDFERLEDVPIFLGILEIPNDAHAGTFREKNGGDFGIVGVAWVKWWLKGNQEAAKMFRGAHCGLCNLPKWEVRKKNID